MKGAKSSLKVHKSFNVNTIIALQSWMSVITKAGSREASLRIFSQGLIHVNNSSCRASS